MLTLDATTAALRGGRKRRHPGQSELIDHMGLQDGVRRDAVPTAQAVPAVRPWRWPPIETVAECSNPRSASKTLVASSEGLSSARGGHYARSAYSIGTDRGATERAVHAVPSTHDSARG